MELCFLLMECQRSAAFLKERTKAGVRLAFSTPLEKPPWVSFCWDDYLYDR